MNYNTTLMITLLAILFCIGYWGATICSELHTINEHLEVVIMDNTHFIQKQCGHND